MHCYKWMDELIIFPFSIISFLLCIKFSLPLGQENENIEQSIKIIENFQLEDTNELSLDNFGAITSNFLGTLGIDNSSVSGMPGAIAGLNELNENEVFEIVSSLMSKGVTIEHLRKLNQMDSSKLSYLLNML